MWLDMLLGMVRGWNPMKTVRYNAMVTARATIIELWTDNLRIQ